MKKNKKTALITGANRGIGKAIAEEFVKKGIQIIGTSTTQNGVNIINKYLKENGFGLVLNLNNTDSIIQNIKNISKKYSIDILINNAGIKKDNLLIKMTDKDWNDVIKTNLTSIFHLIKYVLQSMIKKRYGRIITISSIIGYTGNKGQVNYSASKSGLIGFHKSLALEVASKGITVNIVSPGFIKTDFIKTLNLMQYQKYLSQIPMQRLGYAKEVANAVMFLASEKSSYITGHTLHVNGGMFMI
ncbi:MAG: 3-oxoacyl-[acyl-carrier-protein] reductase [Buchnera aphidicola (Brevicoryne brassicae)]|uniref:3-oxoacyl-[acyl-carrier-protein] reductase n=1 Tax=Buchnera aphidicola (Brevicoryne brassicae) TaxID=911343 RepID=A0AAJ5PTW3_9GAMM|nr:3-oxoacyl-[acyl-carrier-protein] reductase [Buchnera aphidicola]QCI19911.1 3-oxoacyl-[acyl-carrier-protein] reductase [Buchnera aphidicola (Brevicoryne brassicae)]WAI18734.1 MAG: 3-oxoacyl-[acyl-carrier-protein] reductase [Buchnera aphidicola (Brevicoryne brassicae)]